MKLRGYLRGRWGSEVFVGFGNKKVVGNFNKISDGGVVVVVLGLRWVKG